jgi:hypothetical protein
MTSPTRSNKRPRTRSVHWAEVKRGKRRSSSGVKRGRGTGRSADGERLAGTSGRRREPVVRSGGLGSSSGRTSLAVALRRVPQRGQSFMNGRSVMPHCRQKSSFDDRFSLSVPLVVIPLLLLPLLLT